MDPTREVYELECRKELNLTNATEIVTQDAQLVWNNICYDALHAVGASEMSREDVIEIVTDVYECHATPDGLKAIKFLRDRENGRQLARDAIAKAFDAEAYCF